MKKEITLAAGAYSTFPAFGQYIYVEAATGEFAMSIRMKSGKISEETYTARDRVALPDGVGINDITVTDKSGSSNTIVLRISDVLFIPATEDGAAVSVVGTVATSNSSIGAAADAAASSDTGTFSLIALIKRLLSKIPGLGQGTMAASLPVVIASDQSTLSVQAITRTSGGAHAHHLVCAGTTNPTEVKNSPGQVYLFMARNTSAGVRKVAFHDTASTPTAGAAIKYVHVIPASSSVVVTVPTGIEFTNGIAYTTVTGMPDTDATAVSAGDLIIDVFYQ